MWRGMRHPAAGVRPPFSLEKKMRRGRWKRKFFDFVFLAWRTTGRAKASLRSRPLGRWARELAVLSAAPAPSTAPIAARRRQGVSSETIATSTATLRQQGVAESLFVLVGTLADIAHNIHQTRAAQNKPPIPIMPPANSTPAFAGRWDRKRPISTAEIFSSTVHGAFFLTR